MNTKMLALGLAAVVLGSPAIGATFGIQLKGHVPVTCKVQAGLGMIALDGDVVSLGGLRETCNAPAGYDVFVDYSAGLAGSTLLVDGTPVELTGDGSAKFVEEDGPALRQRALELDLGGSELAGETLSFRIVAR